MDRGYSNRRSDDYPNRRLDDYANRRSEDYSNRRSDDYPNRREDYGRGERRDVGRREEFSDEYLRDGEWQVFNQFFQSFETYEKTRKGLKEEQPKASCNWCSVQSRKMSDDVIKSIKKNSDKCFGCYTISFDVSLYPIFGEVHVKRKRQEGFDKAGFEHFSAMFLEKEPANQRDRFVVSDDSWDIIPKSESEDMEEIKLNRKLMLVMLETKVRKLQIYNEEQLGIRPQYR